MSADTAKLIAQAREWTHPEHANLPESLHELVYSLADALEAAEAERDEQKTWVDQCRERLVAAEAEQDDWKQIAQAQAFKALRERTDEAEQGVEYALACIGEWQGRATTAEAIAKDQNRAAIRAAEGWERAEERLHTAEAERDEARATLVETSALQRKTRAAKLDALLRAEKAEAENRRLREALEQIDDWAGGHYEPTDFLRRIARAALADGGGDD